MARNKKPAPVKPEPDTPPRTGRVNGPANGVPTPDWHQPRVHEPYQPPMTEPVPPAPYTPEEG